MRRLFTFGCSFTNWIWPTWADIYATQFDFFENWGMPSAGNLYIFNSIIEANKQYNFNSYDTIVIMWSGVLRLDHYDQRWEFGNEHKSIRSSEIINYGYMNAIDELFKSKKLNYTFLSMTKFDKEGEVYELYKETIDKIKPINYIAVTRDIDLDVNNIQTYTGYHYYIREWYEELRGVSWPTFEDYIQQYPRLAIDKQMKILNKEIKDLYLIYLNDTHPSPMAHLQNLQTWFNFVPDQDTLNWVNEYTAVITKPKYVTYSSNMPANKIK